MTRLILVTFAALGWCFYVMSGGPDFEPRGLRSQQPELVATLPTEAPAPIARSQPADLVTNVAARAAPVKVQPDSEPITTPAEPAVIVDADSLRGFSQISAFSNPDVNFTLASLEDGIAGLQQTTPTPQSDAEQIAVTEPAKDIREISGTRVNLRDGPGTIYPIIGKVQLGQKVEVLDDSGSGWLRLRVLPVQQIGWISESLISKSTN